MSEEHLSKFTSSLNPEGCQTDYSLCIICQDISNETVQNISKLETLEEAMEARQDSTAKRIKSDFHDFLEKNPVWHGNCRRWYTLKKSYMLARKKRELEGTYKYTFKCSIKVKQLGKIISVFRLYINTYKVVCLIAW